MSLAAESRRVGVAARREVVALVTAEVRAKGGARGGEFIAERVAFARDIGYTHRNQRLRVARRFEPAMAADERLSRLHKWQSAVDRSRDWSE